MDYACGLKGSIAWFLEADISWRCLKVHPFLHPNGWNPKGSQFAEVVDIARELSIPILIHTGADECCEAGRYESLLAKNSDINFILAHGNPIGQALDMLKYDNAYVDSAFMPVENMLRIINAGYVDKLLWGTDMCIPMYYKRCGNPEAIYRTKLEQFRQVCTETDFKKVTVNNAINVFGIDKK